MNKLNNLKSLLNARYWAKFFAIFIWCIVICTYIWFFSYLGGEHPTAWENWFKIAISVVVGSIGISYLEKLYIVPYEQFSLQPLLSIIMMVVGFVGVVIGILIFEGFKESWYMQVVGLIYTVICFLAFFYGSSQDRRDLKKHNK